MLIVSNWKAYVASPKQGKGLLAAAAKLAGGAHELVLAPPAPLLGMLATGKGASGVAFAAQTVSESEGGAATGEVTAALLSGLGIGYAIIGHSERRARGETDVEIAVKTKLALAHKITPIVCVGERERDAEAYYLQSLRAQIAAVFEPLAARDRAHVVLAYEPVWAIGKSAAESIEPADLQEMVLYIRKVLAEYLEGPAQRKVRILYGGSVEPNNIANLAEGGSVDGFLIGHASVEPASYRALVKALG